MAILMNLFKLLFDSISFGGISFLVLLISSFMVFPPSLKGERYYIVGYFSTFICVLSLVMMLLSGKYSNRPISNTSSYTPWTWWRLQ
tara:strand:- start:298 stop:558 length:261 start_codon:yes stop_codon:yes gene_type:complete